MQSDAIDAILQQWADERPDLDTSALGVVARVMALYKPLLRRATQSLGAMELELWEYDVLSALRRQGRPYALPATGLARSTGLSTGAMTNRIDNLESRGFVRRKPNPDDRRGVTVCLTAAGRRIVDQAISLRLASAEESLRGLRPAEQERLAALLRKVVITADADDAAAGHL